MTYVDFAVQLPPWLKHCFVKYSLVLNGKRLTDNFSGPSAATTPPQADSHSDTADHDGSRPATAASATSGSAAPSTRNASFAGTFLHAEDCAANARMHLLFELHGPVGEISAAGVSVTAEGATTLLAWAKLFLFERGGRLCGGRWRLRLRQAPVALHGYSTEHQTLPTFGTAVLGVRLVDARLKAQHDVLAGRPLDLHRYLPDGVLGQDILALMAEAEARSKAQTTKGGKPPGAKGDGKTRKKAGRDTLRPGSGDSRSSSPSASVAASSRPSSGARADGRTARTRKSPKRGQRGDLHLHLVTVIGFEVRKRNCVPEKRNRSRWR